MKSIISILLTNFVLVFSSISPANAVEIEWELNFPFKQMGKFYFSKKEAGRYFDDKKIGERNWKFRRDLYVHSDCLKKERPILCSERKLGENRIAKMREAVKRPPRDEYGTTKSSAWLAEAYLDRGNGYSGSKYRYLHNYIRSPDDKGADRHRIHVKLKGEGLDGKRCEFRVLNDTAWYKANCIQGTDKLSIARGDNSSTLQARINSNDEIFSLSGKQTRVKEVVVAAVGDSYASGEGVPDIPARINFVGNKIERALAPGAPSEDRETADNAAHWVERNCHRSYLSAQARAIIHYAAEHPQVETTMLHVACSGAEVISGLLGPYSGAAETNYLKRDLEEAGEIWRTTLSQYNQLIVALCRNPDIRTYKAAFNKYFQSKFSGGIFPKSVKSVYFKNGRNLPMQELGPHNQVEDFFKEKIKCRGGFKRDIDALLISIGGNDSHFFNAVIHVLLDPGLIRNLSNAVSPTDAGKTAKKRTGPLFKLVDEGNETWLGIDRQKVIVSLYPLGVTDTDGSFCNSSEGLSSFNVIGNLIGYRWLANANAPNVTKEESKELHDRFGDVLNKEILKYVALNPGWKISDKHLKWFIGHGWCAGNAKITRNESYKPFGETERWIRTPDDGYASQNRLPVGFEKKRSRLLNDMLKNYGLMHPNGLGAAAIADSYYEQLVKVLGD